MQGVTTTLGAVAQPAPKQPDTKQVRRIPQHGYWQDEAGTTEIAALYRAIMLSPNIHTCEALLRGEDVPASRLDPYWVQRLGVRRAA